MFSFLTLIDAMNWCSRVARTSPCSVIVHHDPYEWKRGEEGLMILERQYSNSFYVRGA